MQPAVKDILRGKRLCLLQAGISFRDHDVVKDIAQRFPVAGG